MTVIENPKNEEDKVKLNLKKKDKDSVNDEISESKLILLKNLIKLKIQIVKNIWNNKKTGHEDSQSFKLSDISKVMSEEDSNNLSKHRRKQSTKI